MTRILHVAAVDFTAAKLLAPQLRWLKSRGYEVRIACRRTDEEYWHELADLDPIDIAFPRSLRPVRMFNAASALACHVETWAPDIVHLHTPAASLPIRAWRFRGWPKGTKIVYTVHGYLHTWPPRGVLERTVQLVEWLESRRTDALLFQSLEDLDQSVRRKYGGHLVLLGNGVEDAWFDISRPQKCDPLKLLFVGRLVREKGILELLEAVARVPGIQLDVAGSALSSDRDPVAAEIRELLERPALLGRVTMHGMLPQDELKRLTAQVHALCLPSYREGMPRSVIEALASGRPVVATDIRGCKELVTHEVNGYLVAVQSVEELALSLRALVDLAEEDYDRMSIAARASVDPSRRECTVFERLVETYERVLRDV